jgi:hypothetical protein
MAASTIASQMRRLTILILAGGLVASPAAAGAPLPSVLTQHARAPFQVRPATIDYTGDGTGFVGGYDGISINDRGHIRWTTYRARSAVGKGLLWLIDSGTLHVVGVTVHLGTPRSGRFQHLTLSFVYRSRRYRDRRTVLCPKGYPASACYWQPVS